MDGRKLVVVEANEVPRRVVADIAPGGRIPFLAQLLRSGRLIETHVDDELDRELYPSQSWASMNTGVDYERHGVYWYGDPKPAGYPLYWQVAAAAGRSVGLVNTLHSSPLSAQCVGDTFRFAVPDCFSLDADTLPASLTAFQELNLRLTRASGRQTDLGPANRDAVRLVSMLPRLGVRPRTMLAIASTVAGIALGRIPRERLRSAQFLILQDLFCRLLAEHAPDLAVFFTNHVAASMHRYWYASYPGDFERDHYDEAWIDQYRHEIPHALILLDRFLHRLHRWCTATDRTLVAVSSMGQGPSAVLDADATHEAVVADARRFLDVLGVDPEVEVLGSMVPQLTLACGGPTRAASTDRLLTAAGAGHGWGVDRVDDVVTLTYRLEVVDPETVRVGDEVCPARSVGVDVLAVDDHSSGRHVPVGILGVANSPTFAGPAGSSVSNLEFAPAVLAHLGVPPLAHHQEPTFRL